MEVVVNIIENGRDEKEKPEHPWPHLDKIFRLKSYQGNSIKFACLLCTPKHVECSEYPNSSSNLRKVIFYIWAKQCCINVLKYSYGRNNVVLMY